MHPTVFNTQDRRYFVAPHQSLFARNGGNSGSWITFILHGQRADFHRPHPGKEALRYRVKDVREFLQRAGVKP